MKPQEWKAIGAFGLLAVGLALYDPGFAVKVVSIAGVIVLVLNADKIPVFGKAVK